MGGRAERHVAVIEAAAGGLLNREIGERLGYSPRTVEGLVDDVRVQLGARNRPHAVARAVEEGLIAPRDPRRLAALTPRQLELAGAMAAGWTAAEAARELGISPHTAIEHLRRARRATGCRTSAALAALVASRDRQAAATLAQADAPPSRDPPDAYRMLLTLLEQGRADEALRWLRQAIAAPSRLRPG